MSRSFLATIAALAFLIVYIGVILVVADWVQTLHGAIQAVFFLLAGTLWVIPMRWLMFWAARKPR